MKEDPSSLSKVMASLGGAMLFATTVAVLTYGGLRLEDIHR